MAEPRFPTAVAGAFAFACPAPRAGRWNGTQPTVTRFLRWCDARTTQGESCAVMERSRGYPPATARFPAPITRKTAFGLSRAARVDSGEPASVDGRKRNGARSSGAGRRTERLCPCRLGAVAFCSQGLFLGWRATENRGTESDPKRSFPLVDSVGLEKHGAAPLETVPASRRLRATSFRAGGEGFVRVPSTKRSGACARRRGTGRFRGTVSS
jgi:hypothetical protein